MDEIFDGSRIHVATGSAPPTHLLEALFNVRDRFTRIDIVLPYTLEHLPVFKALGEPFFLSALHPAGAVRSLVEHEAVEVLQCSVTQWDQVISEDGPRPIDFSFVQVSPPGPEGKVSLGVNGGETAQAVRRAPFLIAQVNSQMPYTFGATELNLDEIDILVDGEEKLIAQPDIIPSEIDLRIADHAAGEIENGAIIQFGIGTLPKAILDRLHDHKDLGVHGGMVSDPVIDLMESGTVNGSTNRLDPGLVVAAGGLGSLELFEWMHRNEKLLMAPASYSHHPSVLGSHEKFTAINSAIEVGLDGSTNSEWVAGEIVSGPGGQPDFAMGANYSKGGRSIIAIPSTTKGGKISRIVRELQAGMPSTLPRYLADVVVTENGVAHLKNRPLPERAKSLRNIADPTFQKLVR